MSNTRFQAGTHALVILAGLDRPTTSEIISNSVDTNPVAVRRLLGDFKEADIVKSRRGRNGGFELARPASEISLLDVYLAVDNNPLFASYDDYPNEECPIGCRMSGALDDMLGPVRRAFEEQLSKITIASLTKRIADSIEAEHGRSSAEIATEFQTNSETIDSV